MRGAAPPPPPSHHTHSQNTLKLAGGIIANTSTCHKDYPSQASTQQCGHMAFVELDATMSYKYAMAFVATGGCMKC